MKNKLKYVTGSKVIKSQKTVGLRPNCMCLRDGGISSKRGRGWRMVMCRVVVESNVQGSINCNVASLIFRYVQQSDQSKCRKKGSSVIFSGLILTRSRDIRYSTV